MRGLIFIVFIGLSIVSPTALHAQSAQNERTVYFLVDISGSMETRLIDAEELLAVEFERILKGDPNTLFSRTEFKARAGAACPTEIPISTPKPIHTWPEPPSNRSFENDQTPLGAALLSAINHAGLGPADIYIASDWAQSPKCGPELTDVISQISDDADISITPIVVRPNESDLSIAQSAQRSASLLVRTSDGDDTVEGNDGDAKHWLIVQTTLFLEKWLWFIGFIMIALNALVVGFQNANKSVELERGVKKVELLQDSIRQEHSGAEEQLQQHIALLDKSTAEEDDRYSNSALFKRYWYGSIAVLLLVLLATTPPDLKIYTFGLGAAQDAAWRVLNSDFATAFAVTWIALLFFYGTQSQRRREALKDLNIATEAADRLINANRHDAHAEYQSLRNTISSVLLSFKENRAHLIVREDDDVVEDLSSAYDGTILFMEQAALGSMLPVSKNDDEDQRLQTEVSNLKTLVAGTGWNVWRTKDPDLPIMIRRLLRSSKLNQHQLLWKALAAAYEADDGEQIRMCLGNLAEKIRA
ncbi:MAG: hypothetical protein NXH88_01795 [Hyphomonas sp.]|nr:hypothetical protein [Hyphomonas sp.]